MGKDFVHLHLHTGFSLLDGLTKIPDLFDKVRALNQSAVAITDHGVMYAMADAAKYAQKNQQHFIPGCELYMVPDVNVKDKNEKSSETEVARKHFLVLAKNNEGYKRLMKICSYGCTDGFYYRPRVDDSTLEKYGTDGLIASSACIGGKIPQFLLKDDYENAKKTAEYYASLFKDGFYLEIQPTYDDGGKQVKINKGLIELAKELGLPLLATTDAHYLNKEDKEAHDVLLCIQSGSLLDDPTRWRFHGDTYYVMSRDELTEAFKCHGHEVLDQKAIEEAMNNTVEVAKQCNVEFTFGKHYLPKINPLEDLKTDEEINSFKKFTDCRVNELMNITGKNKEEVEQQLDMSSEYLRYLCIHGWHGLYSQDVIDERHLSLMFYELDTIISMEFPSYFLILYNIMEYARSHGIPVGPARGCHYTLNKVAVLHKGMQNINNIEVGDEVLGLDNKYHIVLKKYEYDCDEDLIKIKTINNKIIKGTTKGHKVLGIKKEDYLKYNKQPKWYSLDELNIDDYLIQIED